ncbi:DUF4328 domain-containing protein [Bailinhaonella thermotolerans]|uniref:DUF4328 domain-containing protein n=1 Tax=Bailinhaonella thermotolerans TaxID=1070861 RepID=A0A3A4AFU8_9ACTN|nr:DUF4328 domain-containing protein [Bailinhaonella thermotolerans]RJL24513.1 DUF4328 domain-containing protein [Bailinhaonella thermotolerans]
MTTPVPPGPPYGGPLQAQGGHPWAPPPGPRLRSLRGISLAASLALLGVMIAMVGWLFGARANAEALGGAQRRSRPWLVLGWIVPVVWFWFPYQVVADLWTAEETGRPRPGLGLVRVWWASYLVWFAATVWGGYASFAGVEDEFEQIFAGFGGLIWFTVPGLVTGALLIPIVLGLARRHRLRLNPAAPAPVAG